MDLAVYISELLGQQGEVNLPGIGHFVQIRINGYYNEIENKFYPPTHKVNFDPQLNEDDKLAKYIANKKNISLASSKYFVEKYTTGLKQQLASGRAVISGLGYLHTEGQALKFSGGNGLEISDPAFYGFAPVSVQSHEEKPATPYMPPAPKEEVKPVEEIPSLSPEVRITAPAEVSAITHEKPIEETSAPETEEYVYEEPESGRRSNAWIIWLLIVTIIVLAVLGLYKYKPDWFNWKNATTPQTYVAVKPDTLKTAPADTANAATKQDTTAKTAARRPAAAGPATINAAIDTFAVVRYEILGGAFESSEQAEAIMKNYQKLGLQPRIIQHTKGRNHIITLGTYFNKEQADKALDSISVATKLRKGSDIILQTYNPKK